MSESKMSVYISGRVMNVYTVWVTKSFSCMLLLPELSNTSIRERKKNILRVYPSVMSYLKVHAIL